MNESVTFSPALRIESVRLQDFRNIAEARLDFAVARPVFLLAPNGQGKTNLLEALGLITALRSFRTHDTRSLVRWGRPEARLRVDVAHPVRGPTQILLTLGAGSKTAQVDGERIERLGDLLGLFPTVVFNSQDLQLLRGAPLARRQFLDLSLAAVDPAYYETLRRYHGALRERNRALKQRAGKEVIRAFDAILIPSGVALTRRRAEGLSRFASDLEAAYAQISPESEEPALRFQPNLAEADEGAFAAVLGASAERDRETGSTQRGPHRDDWELRLHQRNARDFASEGQQRGLVLALRLAQTRWFAAHAGCRPVILADDILGELDPIRRERFWSAVEPGTQVIASGTALPEASPGAEWSLFEVSNGTFAPVGG